MKYKYFLLALLIVILNCFFRFYNGFNWFDFAHDGDLYSWVVKDILVDGHIRLIGQLTSTPGIFIGSFFYYSIVPFYYLGQMSPLSLVFYSIILSFIVLISYAYVFRRLFDTTSAFIACFLQAVLMSRVMYDRWVVPTVLSSLWEIWFLFCVVMIARGQYFVLPILGILLGFVWQINFGLLPVFFAVLIAFLLSRKLPPIKWIMGGVISAVVVNIPLILFEAKHNFQQFYSLVNALTVDQGGATGISKWLEVIAKISGNIHQLFFYPERGAFPQNVWVPLTIIILAFVLVWKKRLDGKILLVLGSWLIGVMIFFGINSKIISEYYFQNLSIIFLTVVAIGLGSVWKKRVGKISVVVLLMIIGIYNLWVLTSVYQYNHLGFMERRALADFVKKDSTQKGYPCVAISYVTTPGNNFGFRYVFYLAGLKTKPVTAQVPVYTIAIPENMIPKTDSTQRFGAIRLNMPDNTFEMKDLDKNCAESNLNIEDNLFGFYK